MKLERKHFGWRYGQLHAEVVRYLQGEGALIGMAANRLNLMQNSLPPDEREDLELLIEELGKMEKRFIEFVGREPSDER